MKVLFVIHDIGQGGAEKVLVNLVNHMDPSKFEITVLALFGGGVNEQFLAPHVRLLHGHKRMIPGNSKLMKLFSPEQLFRFYIREKYDVIVSYLEGPAARVVSGCPKDGTKLVSWIHVEQHTQENAALAFRSMDEARRCYARFDRTICVSEYVKVDFCSLFPVDHPVEVLYNTVESDRILKLAQERVTWDDCGNLRMIAVGTLKQTKGVHRLIEITHRLRQHRVPVELCILGQGPEAQRLEQQAKDLGIADSVTFLGYQTNPYRYVAKCDLFVCASQAEGFSTAATEALIVGTPVCTVEVSGMKEMLGEHNEYGVVTENDDEALYQGILDLLTIPGKLSHYRHQAALRGRDFRTGETVRAVEQMIQGI